MANETAFATSLSRIGQINATGDANALFLKQFGGEILTAFAAETKFKDRHYVRTITNGRSAQFPMIGTAGTKYHNPGEYIDGASINHAERTITIDGLLIAPAFVAQLDELMNHYDIRGPYATELGRGLAKVFDQNVARMAVLSARQSTSDLTGRAGGTKITNAAMLTSSTALAAGIWAAAEALDTKNVAEDNRTCFVRPMQFYLMANDTTLINTLYGGKGSVSTGKIETLAGIPIVKTNHVPATNLSADTDVFAKYRADYSKTAGIIMGRQAVGTVQLMDISLGSEWEERHQGTFMVAKMATGTDILRSDEAIELANT